MSVTIEIEGRKVGPEHPAFIIAEIGINHDGNEDTASEMIRAAAAAGADAVKFQTVDADESYLPGTDSYREFSGRALSLDAYQRLNATARNLGVIPFSTPGDIKSLEVIVSSGMRALKVSSGQMTNVPILRHCAASGLPIIMSTGMANQEEVNAAVEILEAAGAEQIAILHCTSLYPAPADALNLLALKTLINAFPYPIGYSDHFIGPTAVIASIALGATIIEKHFSLDSTKPGADHHLSAEPEEFSQLVRHIRQTEQMLGSGTKTAHSEESRMRVDRMRYLVARQDLAAKTTLREEHLLAMRITKHQGGIAATEFDDVVGSLLKRSVAKGTPIQPEDLAS
ncbi:MAG: N-acetylneuraminate synthase family protein [Pseudomonadota bacterium]